MRAERSIGRDSLPNRRENKFNSGQNSKKIISKCDKHNNLLMENAIGRGQKGEKKRTAGFAAPHHGVHPIRAG